MATDTCPKCGQYLIDTCPECHQPVTTYSRIVGYLRPIGCWNEGKVQEYHDRTEYTHWGPDPSWYEKYKTDLTNEQAKTTD